MWIPCERLWDAHTTMELSQSQGSRSGNGTGTGTGTGGRNLTSSSSVSLLHVMLFMMVMSSTNLFVMGPSAVSAAMAFPSVSSTRQLDFYRPDKNFMMAKKSATALNKLMIALRSYEKTSAEKGSAGDTTDSNSAKYGSGYDSTFNLQRRNQKERKIYLRCYFNAVSCF